MIGTPFFKLERLNQEKKNKKFGVYQLKKKNRKTERRKSRNQLTDEKAPTCNITKGMCKDV